MSTSATETQQDTLEQRDGHLVELACGECGDAWTVLVSAGADLTDAQVACPDRDCDGTGEEL